MDATTVAVDLAKNVFELAVADRHWMIVERQRLTRGQFERWFANRAIAQVLCRFVPTPDAGYTTAGETPTAINLV